MAPHRSTICKSRRSVLGGALWAAAGAALVQVQPLLRDRGWLAAAQAATLDLVHDTFNGLIAFILPGSDPYSIAQGVSTAEPGGVDAGATDVLIATVDESTPFVPSFSAQVSSILNSLAGIVNSAPSGTFVSPFAALSFAEKAAVFQVMDATDTLQLLGGILPPFIAFFCYSEAGVFDPDTRSISGQPLGWRLSSYQGVADGRAEFLGYFARSQDRK